MSDEKTATAKAIEAAERQHPKGGKRGLYDAAAKRLVATRSILAWIVRKCVKEAAQFSLQDIATKYIDADVRVMQMPVYRDDAADPGSAKMEQREDADKHEGVIR